LEKQQIELTLNTGTVILGLNGKEYEGFVIGLSMIILELIMRLFGVL